MTLSHLKKEESDDQSPVETATTSLPRAELLLEGQVELGPVEGDGVLAGGPVQPSVGDPPQAAPAPDVLNFHHEISEIGFTEKLFHTPPSVDVMLLTGNCHTADTAASLSSWDAALRQSQF